MADSEQRYIGVEKADEKYPFPHFIVEATASRIVSFCVDGVGGVGWKVLAEGDAKEIAAASALCETCLQSPESRHGRL